MAGKGLLISLILYSLFTYSQVSEIIPARKIIKEYRMNQWFVNVGLNTVVNSGKTWDGVEFGGTVVFKKGVLLGLEYNINSRGVHGPGFDFGLLLRGGKSMHLKKYRSD